MVSSSSTPARDCEGSVSRTEHNEASASAAGAILTNTTVPLAASQEREDFPGV